MTSRLRSPRLALGVLGFLAAYCGLAAWLPWSSAGAEVPGWAVRPGLARPFAAPTFLLAVGLLFLSTLACLWDRTPGTLRLWRGRGEGYGVELESHSGVDLREFLRAEGFRGASQPLFRYRHALWGGWVLHLGLVVLIAGVAVQQGFHEGGAFEVSEGERLSLSAPGAVFSRERGPLAPDTPPALLVTPLSPKGRSSVIDSPPWHYGGDRLAIRFSMDRKRAQAFIPPPLEMGPRPGEGMVWFPEWVSVSDAQPDLAFVNPERAVYRECFVMLNCQFKGVPGYFVPFIWVDNDFTLMRGFVQGFPKKLGKVYLTKLHELCPKVGGRRVGARVKGILEAHGERIVEGSMVFTRKAKAEDLPAVKFYLMRHLFCSRGLV